jgi:predicted AAA+ superfamily ATPase
VYRRNIEVRLKEALSNTSVVLLTGARGTGKTALAHSICKDLGGRFISLDDATLLAEVKSDPEAFLGKDGLTVIDEVQKSPGFLQEVGKVGGRYLLTGSAGVEGPNRLEILPLSQDELEDGRSEFVETLFSGRAWPERNHKIDRDEIFARILRGGFPGGADTEGFRDYISSLLHRDIRDLANIEGLTELPGLLKLLAARGGALLNMSELSRASGIAHSTLRRYLGLLEAVFLYQPLPAWSADTETRLVKSPKIHLVDTGLAAHLWGEANPAALLESFVVQEVRKQLSWSPLRIMPHHFRTATGRGVGLVLEDPEGRVAGIEVRASATLDRRDLSGFGALATVAGGRFVRGVVLYLGERTAAKGDRLWAVPLPALWHQEGRRKAFGASSQQEDDILGLGGLGNF